MNNDIPMQLSEDEISKLNKCNKEVDWYKICDEIKERRNGQYPSYLSRQILELFQQKFPPQIDD
tara:strand:- start:180 stop:371 length:192 start_codon:yes stop_codon:yes gene_type:complete